MKKTKTYSEELIEMAKRIKEISQELLDQTRKYKQKDLEEMVKDSKWIQVRNNVIDEMTSKLSKLPGCEGWRYEDEIGRISAFGEFKDQFKDLGLFLGGNSASSVKKYILDVKDSIRAFLDKSWDFASCYEMIAEKRKEEKENTLESLREEDDEE